VPSQAIGEEQREDLKIMGRSYTIAFNAEVDKPGRVIPEKVRMCVYVLACMHVF